MSNKLTNVAKRFSKLELSPIFQIIMGGGGGDRGCIEILVKLFVH